MDRLSPEERSRLMSRIRGKDTKPELFVRALLRSLGYRYRLHVRHLPGRPDFVFPSSRKVLFVHGCFWHRHVCRRGRSMPATRSAFWLRKFQGNKARDTRSQRAIRQLGWKSLTIWECQSTPSQLPRLAARIIAFLEERPE